MKPSSTTTNVVNSFNTLFLRYSPFSKRLFQKPHHKFIKHNIIRSGYVLGKMVSTRPTKNKKRARVRTLILLQRWRPNYLSSLKYCSYRRTYVLIFYIESRKRDLAIHRFRQNPPHFKVFYAIYVFCLLTWIDICMKARGYEGNYSKGVQMFLLRRFLEILSKMWTKSTMK